MRIGNESWAISLVAVACLVFGTMCSGDESNSGGGNKNTDGVESDCNDNVDNDCDGQTDCRDADCAAAAPCKASEGGSATKETNCVDGNDDDGDGNTDCDDDDCSYLPVCEETPAAGEETSCTNGRDDDNDGAVDCADDDCGDHPLCEEPAAPAGLSCQGLFGCYSCCPANDEACMTACGNAASVDAQAQIMEINACLMGSCMEACDGTTGTEEACTACVGENCQTQLDSCGWGATEGTGGCFVLLTCLQSCAPPAQAGTGDAESCPTDPGLACFDECLGGSDQNGMDLFLAFNNCIADKCGEICETNQGECQRCIQQECGEALGACAADR